MTDLGLTTCFLFILWYRKPCYIDYYENVNSIMKYHDIISNNISINKGKKTYKERICNQQKIKLL